MAGEYRFSFGTWNIYEGADRFVPMMWCSNDAVPDIDNFFLKQIAKKAKELRSMHKGNVLVADLVAPRRWKGKRTIDGAYTSHDPAYRQYAKDCSWQMLDIVDALGTKMVVVWYGREGMYIREAKDSKLADQIAETLNDMLNHNTEVKSANEPMEKYTILTSGHEVANDYLLDMALWV